MEETILSTSISRDPFGGNRTGEVGGLVGTGPWYGGVWCGEDRPTQAGTGQWTGAGGARRLCAALHPAERGSLSPIHHTSIISLYSSF